MKLCYETLPSAMRCSEVRRCLEDLQRRRGALRAKRIFDFCAALLLLVLTLPLTLLIAAAVGVSSGGGVLFRQRRVTAGGREFFILKFRTMRPGAQSRGGLTTRDDPRITPVGRLLRGVRLDELPQLVNILRGEMSFVGARPELPEYVAYYTPEMLTTLLLPAGLTGPASLRFKDEARLLGQGDPHEIYIRQVLPVKMAYNIEYIRNFSFFGDIRLLLETAAVIFRGE